MAFEPVYVVDGARSPFLKARTGPGPFAASDLAVQAGRALLLRQPFSPTDLDEVVIGCAAPSPEEVNIGRVIGLRLGCGHRVPGWTVQRNCASGMQALDSAIANIQLGRSALVLAGGTDALSRAPLLFSDEMAGWLAQWFAARGLGARLTLIGKLRPRYLAPVIGLLKGLTDPVVGLSMGQTAENLATRFGIDRAMMDAYSARSHERVLAAREAGRLTEIQPLADGQGRLYPADDGVRADSSIDKLARLKPVFDKPFGNVTRATAPRSATARHCCCWPPKPRCGTGNCGPSGASSTANGPGWIRPRWAWDRSTRPRPSCNATAWRSTTWTCGRSTRPSPPRCWPARPPGRTRPIAVNTSARRPGARWIPNA